eukprot:TRINITY_DN10289_c0_g1_i1.p1 TRINITY_DN10289_c0_g1~~TRINITY_DN10289_c0_g1_i1.p1  ORF type:complete len:338 (-),score=64.90 TRINITY_DN10289_c0_g1_i1:21-1034(-)
MSEKHNWGIVGSGRICSDFVTALQTQVKNGKVLGIYSRSQQSADSFGDKFGIPHRYHQLDDLIGNDQIQFVYIGNLHPFHFEAAEAAINAGKHLLIEKPITVNANRAQVLVELAKEKGVFLMEALWTRFFPSIKQILQVIEDGAIGDVKFLNGTFGFTGLDTPRLSQNHLGGGALLDIGVYLLSVTCFVLKQTPELIHAHGVLQNDVDVLLSMSLQVPEGPLATLTCSINSVFQNEYCIHGTKGYIKIPSPFWCPTGYILYVDGEESKVEFDLPQVEEEFCFTNSVGLSYEIQHVQECVDNGLLESPLLGFDFLVERMRLMDQIRESIGLVYPVDSQ